jgi:hypothetical protein
MCTKSNARAAPYTLTLINCWIPRYHFTRDIQPRHDDHS